MKIIYNNILPPKGFSAIMLFGIIFARKKCRPLSASTILHEAIHKAQAKDAGGYIPYYVLYLYWWLWRGYRNSPFEQEAYENQSSIFYLSFRQKNAWKNYI